MKISGLLVILRTFTSYATLRQLSRKTAGRTKTLEMSKRSGWRPLQHLLVSLFDLTLRCRDKKLGHSHLIFRETAGPSK